MKLVEASLDAYLARSHPLERELRWLLCGCRQPVILDIGACEGEDSIRLARMFPNSRVFSFEPLPANQDLIRRNFVRYGVANAELVPRALSDRAGEAVLHVSSGRPPELHAGEDWNYGNKSSSLLAPAVAGPMHGWLSFPETVIVPTGTLDEFCRQRGLDHLDFIQLDVQGAEQLVLTGATAVLPQVTGIWLEVSTREHYRGQPLESDIACFMRGHGFTLAHADYRGDASGEGDHLYLNTRHWRTRIYHATHRLRAAAGRAKRILHS